MKDTLLKIVRAFIALLHTDSDDQATIAALKKQVTDLTAAATLSDDESAEVTNALNQIGAATPPTAADVAPVAAVAPAPSPQPAVVAAATSAVPADVTAAAAVPPTA
jgi:hypothetical protein